ILRSSHLSNLQHIYGNQAFLRMRESGAPLITLRPSQVGVLQRKSACGARSGLEGECAECRQMQEAILKCRTSNQTELETVPLIVHEVLRSPGQPLDPSIRAFLEPRFGHDFSHVRIHTGAQAAESARVVNALAYTVGRDVVFAAGQWSPATRDG